MGYHTEFYGEFVLNHPLTPEHHAYLTKFSETRRMRRVADTTATRKDPLREAVGLLIGDEGEYFVGGEGYAGQEQGAPDIVSYNVPPGHQPGLWCGWTPSKDGEKIVWNEVEKFYNYVEWLEYLVGRFLKPWGYTVSGKVEWSGSDNSDHGTIYVKDNVVEAVNDYNPGPSWALGSD